MFFPSRAPACDDGQMLLCALALATPVPTSSPLPTDRLKGLHLGMGVGFGLYARTEFFSGESVTAVSVSSYTSLRLRFGRTFALEPTFRIERSGGKDTVEGSEVITLHHEDSFTVGLRFR